MQRFLSTSWVFCLGAALCVVSVDAMADRRPGSEPSARAQREAAKKAKEQQVNEYPNSTRIDPEVDPGSSAKKLNQAQDLITEDKLDEAQAAIDDVLGGKKLTPYAKAMAMYFQSQVKWQREDYPGAIADLKQAIELDAMPNSAQFPSMLNLAQLYLMEEKYNEALVAVDDYLKKSGSQKGDALAVKANALYRLERYQDAINAMKDAISKSDKPNESWNQILMASYFELDQYDEAAKLSEAQLAKDPGNKKVLQQLSSIYINGGKPEKALALLTDAKAKGQFTTADDYKLLAQLYGQADKPKDGALVLEEGFQKGIVKPSYDMYKLLGDSYAMGEDDAKAIEAYAKASPLAKDGEADFLRGQLMVQSERWAEARDTMKQAIQRGVKRPGAAHVLLGNAENELGNKAGAIAAMEKAKGYEETRVMADTWLRSIRGSGGPQKKK